jgi:predicted transcriptional regulator with HTH domain
MLDQLFNSKTRVKILSLFESESDTGSYYLQEIVRLTKTDPASIHRELKTLEEMSLLESTAKGNQKYFKINTQNPYWSNIKQLISTYKNNSLNRWFYYTDSKDIFPLIHFSTVDEKLNKVFFDKICVKLESYDFASYNTEKNTDMWLKYDQCNEIEQKFKSLFFENPDQILKLCRESLTAGENLKKYVERWQVLNFSSLDVKELAKELREFVSLHGKFEIYHWLHSILETGNLVINQELLERMKLKNSKKYLSDFGFLTNVFEPSIATQEYNNLLDILDVIQRNTSAKAYFKSNELRIIQKNLWSQQPEIYLKIIEHSSKFGYLGFGRKGPSWIESYFIETLKNLIDTDIQFPTLDLKNQTRQSTLKQTQSKLEENSYPELSSFLQNYRECIKTKIFRKEITYFCYELLNELLLELSNKTNCSFSALQQMYQNDLENLINGKELNVEALNKKALEHLMIRENHNSDFYMDFDYSEIMNQLRLPKPEVNAFYGKCFVAGRVRGESFVYKSKTKEIPKFSILIIDSSKDNLKTNFLEQNLENILGFIFTNKPDNNAESLLFTRQYNIPCIFDLDFKETTTENKLLDLDSTYGKVVVI